MRNILGIAGVVCLVLLVAVSQIRPSDPNPGALTRGNAFAQEPGRSASDDQQGSRAIGAPLQQLPEPELATTPVPEPRGDRRFSQTPQRYTRTPTPTM